jgi:hypothetical protein
MRFALPGNFNYAAAAPGGPGRAVFFGVPGAMVNPNQTTVTYYVGPETFQQTDTITVAAAS